MKKDWVTFTENVGRETDISWEDFLKIDEMNSNEFLSSDFFASILNFYLVLHSKKAQIIWISIFAGFY